MKYTLLATFLLANTYLGNAAWICTPSGYGHTSTCFQRPLQAH